MSNLGDPPPPPEPQPDPSSASFPAVESLRFGSGTGAVPSAPDGSAADVSPADVVAAPSPRGRGRRAAIVGGSALAVLLVGGGVVWAVSTFAAGGAQPETVVPANAIAYADLDLDPSAGQKVAAYRFLNKFPSVDKSASEGDLVDQVLRTVFDDSSDVDYAKDIKPWIGKRMAIAAIPEPAGTHGPVIPLVVVQVKDEDKASTELRRLLDQKADEVHYGPSATVDGFGSRSEDDQLTGLVVRDGFALVSTDQATTERLSEAATSANLADAANFSADLGSLGDLGVATGWVDVDAAVAKAGADLNEVMPGGLLKGRKGGRLAATVRFGGGNAELVARSVGASSPTGSGHPGGPLLQALPADTTGAIAVGDADLYTTNLGSTLDTLGLLTTGTSADALGLKLPEDLQSLLGTAFTVSVGDVTASTPQVALRVQTTDPAASKAVVSKLVAGAGRWGDGADSLPPIAQQLAPDGVVYASSPEFAAKVATAGTLGQDPAFTAAVPEAATATTAGYLNFDQVRRQVTDPEMLSNLAPLRSAGLTVRTVGGDSELQVRLVAK